MHHVSSVVHLSLSQGKKLPECRSGTSHDPIGQVYEWTYRPHSGTKPCMKFGFRLAIIALGPLAAMAVILLGRGVLPSLPGRVGEPLADAHGWLLIITVLYIINFLISWRFWASWPVFVTRALIWALIAYLCISNIVDLFGENSKIGWQILGAEGGGDRAVVTGLRGQLYSWAVGLAMAAICIGIGFESSRVDREQGT